MGLGTMNYWITMCDVCDWVTCFAVTYFEVFPFPQFFMRNNQWSQQTTNLCSDTKPDLPRPGQCPLMMTWAAVSASANHRPASVAPDQWGVRDGWRALVSWLCDTVRHVTPINIHSPPQNTRAPPAPVFIKLPRTHGHIDHWWAVSRH